MKNSYLKFIEALVKPKIIKIKYFYDDLPRLEKIDKGDWIDLRTAYEVKMRKEEALLIPLGVAMELPKGYEAHIVPRSSTYKKFGIIQTNHMGVIDESYCGNNDQWMMTAYALHNTIIPKHTRICQFRIIEKMPDIEFEEVLFLENEDRTGFGSTGHD